MPYMVSPGNHKANCIDSNYDCPIGQSNFTGFINHFRMPSDVISQAKDNYGVGNMWYSFDNGIVHYVSLDMETDFPGYPDTFGNPNASYPNGTFGYTGEQVAWLTADLAAVDRCKTPWIIVVVYRQWYSASSGGQCLTCQTAFEELFVRYNVDIYVSGHYHVYERLTPVGLNGTIDPAGLDNPSSPWYIINGIGGHYGGLHPFKQADPYRIYGLDINNATYGWSRLTFHNKTHLTHEFVNSSSNAVLDRTTLFKNHCPVILSSTSSSTAHSTTTSTRATAATRAPTATPLICNHNNCLRQLLRKTAIFEPLCNSYTATVNTAVPTAFSNCDGSPARV
jgi:hypothetical protein